MNKICNNSFIEFENFFINRNFEKSRRFHEKHIYNPEPIKSLLNALDNPQLSYKTIHIAGTSGKGSTATFLARALAKNFKTGLFTSPHYEKINERISINEKVISDEEFGMLWNIIKNYEKVHEISYFDALTVISMIYFRNKKVDWAVFETGLGGRYDSTNTIHPDMCIITEIGLDHQKILGNTIQEIAFEKAGIIKKAIPVYASVHNSLAREVLNRVGIEVGASVEFFDKLSNVLFLEKNYSFVQWIYKKHFLMPMPEIQREIKGRIEVINCRPLTIFDSAHNVISFKELIQWLNKQEALEWNVYINLMKERSLADAIHSFQGETLKKINIFLFPFEEAGFYQNSDIPTGDQIKVISINEFMKILTNENVSHLVTGSIKLYSPIKQILESLNLPSFQHSTTC